MAAAPDYPATADGLMAILRRLRAPDGCPWDKKQTPQSLTKSLASEAGEVIDAIDRNNPADLCEELGDLMMNVLFQIEIAEEKGDFTLQDVFSGINGKMVRRHAHIFGDAKAETPEEVSALWQAIKAKEHAAAGQTNASVLDGVPHSLSALERAAKLQKKAAETGFDWPDEAGVLAKVGEELAELREAAAAKNDANIDEEAGDLLFAIVNFLRFRHKSSAEEALRAASRKFERRFRFIEAALAEEGKPIAEAPPAEMDFWWNEAKKSERRH